MYIKHKRENEVPLAIPALKFILVVCVGSVGGGVGGGEVDIWGPGTDFHPPDWWFQEHIAPKQEEQVEEEWIYFCGVVYYSNF